MNCAIESCLKRHPNPCKFFFLTRKCKFKEDCSYSHQFDKKDDSKEALEDKMVEVEELQNENQKLKNENEKLKKENDILIATIKDLENTTATLRGDFRTQNQVKVGKPSQQGGRGLEFYLVFPNFEVGKCFFLGGRVCILCQFPNLFGG